MIHLSTPQRFFIHELHELVHELHEFTRNSKNIFFLLINDFVEKVSLCQSERRPTPVPKYGIFNRWARRQGAKK